MDADLFCKRVEIARRLLRERGKRPWFEGWSVTWKLVFTLKERLVLSHLYSLTLNLFDSDSEAVRNDLLDQEGGVRRTNRTIADDTEMSESDVKNKLASLEKKGAIIRRRTTADAASRVFEVNLDLLEMLDAAWMTYGNRYDQKSGHTRMEFVKAREDAVKTVFEAYQRGGSQFLARGVANFWPTLVCKTSMSEVSSSKKPAVSGETASAASQTVPSRRRIPQGLLTPQAVPCHQEEKTTQPQESLNTTFRRRPTPEQTPVHKEPFAFSRAEKQIMDYWNRKESLRTHKLPGRGEPSNTILSFRAALKKVMDGTLFKGLEDTAQEHARAYSVAEVIRAIDAFAVADPALRKGVGIDDFFFNPNRAGGRNGFGRSWFLSALHGDVRSAVGGMTDHYPDLTEHLRKKFAYTILKGNPMPLDTIDKNNMVKAAAMIMELYHEHEEQLSRLNQTPEVMANKLMEHAARWNRNGATTPSTLCQPALFKALRVELTKNGYLRQDEMLTEDAPEPMLRVGDTIADTRTPEEKEKDRIRAMVYSWPEAVRESMMKAKGIPLDILD